ncbi:hypothetical protein M2322_004619 [Rhodoblastus acidophilus]|uniref:GvpL/GvpF family gas vesicle protein n=1 Tax=Rhodoblastus acidophilus TaxID=1074 RepID=UPI0022242BD1|nr:GvpL/GvpF family gas vesicle protein [Rhodoblastus acidophilus]MCW2319050.1 hypothetical protein [Rhodoblastus acidophilus]
MLICHGAIRARDARLAEDLDGAARPTRVIEAGALAGLASFYPDDAMPERDVEALALAHNDLLCRFAALGDVAPLRLDRVYADEAELRAALLGDSDRLIRLLDRIAGRLEFSAKLGVAPDEPAPSRNGREFLRARSSVRGAAARQARTAFIKNLAGGGFASCDAVHRLPPPASGAPQATLARFALLAPREKFPALEAETAQLMAQAEGLGLRLEVSGPWAPYVFTAEEDAHAGAA